jgi:hypothetical protein
VLRDREGNLFKFQDIAAAGVRGIQERVAIFAVAVQRLWARQQSSASPRLRGEVEVRGSSSLFVIVEF